MGFLSRFFKHGNEDVSALIASETVQLPEIQEIIEEEDVVLDLPEGEIVGISTEVLNTNSKECIEKFKHNLRVLIERTKRDGKIDKFMLIREDDYFPRNWQWQVASKNTNLEKINVSLSIALMKRYALEKAGVQTKMNGFTLPVDPRVEAEAMKNVDIRMCSVLLPSYFRSTKHFTVNTPLGYTGDYNGVKADRNFIVIDGIDNFLKSGYGYSVAYHDAYLDVTHESLPISSEAVVLIEKSKYEKIKNDEEVMRELHGRKVVIFTGDESLAINMVLSEMGALPSQIGSLYADYDEELGTIIDSSIRELAQDNHLMFDKSHGGSNGHFTDYYDEKNIDRNKALNEFIEFLAQKFPQYSDLFTHSTINNGNRVEEIIDMVGLDNLINAVNEFNSMIQSRFEERYASYNKDRASIAPEVHNMFRTTIMLINKYYMGEVSYETMDEKYSIEERIRIFLQGDTVKEQLEAAKDIIDFMKRREITLEDEIEENVVKK